MRKIFFLVCVSFSIGLNAQTPGLKRLESFELRSKMPSTFDALPLRSIGPTIMSGRVTDIAWNPNNPSHFYVAYASGGLWVTYNMGTTFEPIMDELPAMTIGAIAVDWQNNVIWVGTGENNSSRSSYSGVGIYCSEDNGATWQYKGLPESHHIGKIIVHPNDRSVVYVAALGHLYSPNKERGIYKTTDGGNTWTHQLFVDENTGAIDLEMNPKNPDELIASMWYRKRRAWNFEESGPTSGIYHTQSG
ncbi:MAG: WD40/YVTN/BNR-like repeat-containing protein, partial [Flavobacteriales bacterium]